MSKSPWGIGAWAAEAEREEAEEREAAEKAAADAAAQPAASFPSLKESVSTAKQKKKTKMTLQEFRMQQSPSAPGRGLTPEEMLRLPTGPKERSADEMQYGRLGGGFSNYGARSGSGGPNTGRPREFEGRRSYGFEDDGRRGAPQQSRVSEFDQPSRADEVDNWASMKKQTLPAEYNSREARPVGKYSSLGGSGGASRADEVDNWASTKKPISQPQPQQARSSGFGSGFSRPDSDRWTRNESFGSGFSKPESRPESDRWARSEQNPSLSLSSPKAEVAEAVKVKKPNPFGAARPREDVLAEKGLDWKKLDLEISEKKLQHSVSGGSRPTSSHSSRPETPQSSRSEASPALAGTADVEVKQKPKINPFGDAKPREVLLEEKGLDWKKIDLNLDRRVDRKIEANSIDSLSNGKMRASDGWDYRWKLWAIECQMEAWNLVAKERPSRAETEEEKNVKEEIEQLKKELLQKSGEEQAGVQDVIHKKEQDLENLVRQLDDKVRYSQRNFERQSSGAGRGGGFTDRPPSRPGFHDRPPSSPGTYEEPRAGYQERPPSRPGVYEDSRAGFAERPPSRPGATYEDPQAGYHDRPRSRPGAYEETRSSYPQRSSFTDGAHHEANERPRSRGTGNSWARPSDDRTYFQGGGGGGRGFSGSRDVDRSGSRW